MRNHTTIQAGLLAGAMLLANTAFANPQSQKSIDKSGLIKLEKRVETCGEHKAVDGNPMPDGHCCKYKGSMLEEASSELKATAKALAGSVGAREAGVLASSVGVVAGSFVVVGGAGAVVAAIGLQAASENRLLQKQVTKSEGKAQSEAISVAKAERVGPQE